MTHPEPPRIDSQSLGDPTRHLSLAHLERALAQRPGAPADDGRVTLIVRRGAGGRRESLDRVDLRCNAGVPGDAWSRRGVPNPDAQIAVIQQGVAELIANGQPLVLFGDNLLLDLDLSRENLPLGTRLRVGAATVLVTPKAHNGCHKFQARFGSDALRFVSKPELRHRNLRGIYLRVIDDGPVMVGDRVAVLMRPLPSDSPASG